MKNLTKELQERNREEFEKDLELEEGEELGAYIVTPEQLDTITAQTVQATLERVREIVEEKRPTKDDLNSSYGEHYEWADQALDDIIKKLDI